MLSATPRWEDFQPAGQATFRAFHTRGTGETKIPVDNHFIERNLPKSILRDQTDAKMAAHRALYPEREDRRPILIWPREMPVAGQPADVVEPS